MVTQLVRFTVFAKKTFETMDHLLTTSDFPDLVVIKTDLVGT